MKELVEQIAAAYEAFFAHYIFSQVLRRASPER